ncbi:toll/interleukin-1 receptor domain-containing protein [Umezawaea sp. NPDC059074]|uniref:toll/interleukin-1 receptor domain-containing protein n=1 Tax=Umezawaea sp. NPDC059074 TaxID=3346716 RepID=UPI0036A1EFD1
MPKFFVNYRTVDSVHSAAAIADRLARHFGPENVFRDRDSLALGALYPKKIRRALERCDKVLAVIGPTWLDVEDAFGRRRLDNPKDWVRTELQMAFERDIPVVPVLLDNTPLPSFDQLPAVIAQLSNCAYWQVRQKSFESDLRGLIAGISAHEDQAGSEVEVAQYVQHNTASDNGRVIATQGGNHVFTFNNGGRDSR